MGIPNLYSFVTQQVKCCLVDINMLEEVNNWSRENEYITPTIVIDFGSFIYAILSNRLESFFGCRSVYCFDKIEKIFKRFQQEGIKLVFFEDGPIQLDKSDNSIDRQNKRIKNIFRLLDELYKCDLVCQLIKKYEIRYPGTLITGIRALARKYGEFYISYDNECDKELVAHAIKCNAVAILGHDTDFLIFGGNWSYWSMKHINFNKLETKKYCKITLQNHLKLTENEMPLFGTLAGNDFISRDLLADFHRKINQFQLTHYPFMNISQYIICNLREVINCTPEFIAEKIFGHTDKLSEYTELIRISLNSYSAQLAPAKNVENDFVRRIKGLQNECYAYLFDCPGSCRISYFDVRTPQFEKYSMVALELIQRQLGIILQHKNDKSLTRQIYCYQNGQYMCKTLYPEYPTITVPGLGDLYNADKNGKLKLKKLQLLAWILSDRLNFKAIKHINNKYLCVCLTLYCMVQNEFITVREADIFLHMVETVYEAFWKIKRVSPEEMPRVNARAFQILFLYDKIYEHIMDAILNCGLFELIDYNPMDGVYFHNAYQKMIRPRHLRHLRLYAEL